MSPTYYQDREAKARAALQPAVIFAAVSVAISAVLLGNNIPGDAIHAFTLGICMVAVFVFMWWRYTLLPTELGSCTLKSFDAEIQHIINGTTDQAWMEHARDIDLENRLLRLDWLERWIPEHLHIHIDEERVEIKLVQRERKQVAEREAAIASSRPTLFSTLSRLSRDIPSRTETGHHTPGNSALMDACRETDELFNTINSPTSRERAFCAIKVEMITREGFQQALSDHVTHLGCEADVLALRRDDLPDLCRFCRDELPAAMVDFSSCHVMGLACEYADPDVPTHVYARRDGDSHRMLLSFPRPVEERLNAMQDNLRMVANALGVQIPEPAPPPRVEPEEPRLRRFDF